MCKHDISVSRVNILRKINNYSLIMRTFFLTYLHILKNNLGCDKLGSITKKENRIPKILTPEFFLTCFSVGLWPLFFLYLKLKALV